MEKGSEIYRQYVQILKEELVPAMGCTEPIALAYAAALAREQLGALPERAEILVSGNIIKNVKSVVVPHTGGLRGIPAAAAAGIVAGAAEKKLEVLSAVSPEQIRQIGEYLKSHEMTVGKIDSPFVFDIEVTLFRGEDRAAARILGSHTNVVRLSKNGAHVVKKPCEEKKNADKTNRSVLSVAGILDFADSVELEDVRATLDRQIEYNWAIAQEGMRSNYGANIGKVLKNAYGDHISNRARYMAAAASDARMNGCELPVVINSGSGNQGITASVPVIVFAQANHIPDETLYRALIISNLCTVHIKTGIGTLSAYCGAVSAGCGAAAGIAYLLGGDYEDVKHTLVNSMAIDSGIICDGAKASCAAKIASAVDAGLLGYQMYKQGNEFFAGDGIVRKGVESTIQAVGSLAHIGMVDTDREILQIMMKEE